MRRRHSSYVVGRDEIDNTRKTQLTFRTCAHESRDRDSIKEGYFAFGEMCVEKPRRQFSKSSEIQSLKFKDAAVERERYKSGAQEAAEMTLTLTL